ncbi:MAG TPA: hypothetical protein VF595_02380 [Tepidisphaeraceae bacterium]|jgi:hypothetical protein
MSPSELADLFEKNPTQPYRLILDSGDRVIVADPRKTLVSQITLFLRASEDVEKQLGKVSMVAIPNITMIEPIDRPQLPTRSRRRK